MKKLLIVDDDLNFGQELKQTLIEQGLHTELVTNGTDCMHVLKNFRFDFILLDWNLPDISGFEVCRQYRADGGKTPIVFLTGRHGIEDKESGLDAGADDYLTKPFHVRELLARLRTIERRTANFEHDSYTVRDLQLKPNLRMVTRGEHKVKLSLTETEILAFLMRNRDKFLSASEIFAAVWPSESQTDHAVVRSHIKFLRRRLERIEADDLIETVSGAGYIIRSDPHSR